MTEASWKLKSNVEISPALTIEELGAPIEIPGAFVSLTWTILDLGIAGLLD